MSYAKVITTFLKYGSSGFKSYATQEFSQTRSSGSPTMLPWPSGLNLHSQGIQLASCPVLTSCIAKNENNFKTCTMFGVTDSMAAAWWGGVKGFLFNYGNPIWPLDSRWESKKLKLAFFLETVRLEYDHLAMSSIRWLV